MAAKQFHDTNRRTARRQKAALPSHIHESDSDEWWSGSDDSQPGAVAIPGIRSRFDEGDDDSGSICWGDSSIEQQQDAIEGLTPNQGELLIGAEIVDVGHEEFEIILFL